jgi:lipoprotein-releasing system ATP-binding protein
MSDRVRDADSSARHPLEAREITKSYVAGDGSELDVLRGVSLTVRSGEAVAITGASGTGKSTLLHIIGALDQPTSGQVRLGGDDVAHLDDEELGVVRNRHVGFVFQFHHLLREFTAIENVMMPALVAGVDLKQAREAARQLLGSVGITGRDDHKPRQLSGGEQQRVAVARALVNRPSVLLADEPSGNLDTHTSERLHDLLFELKEEHGLSMAIVTHSPDLAGRADRQLDLADGRLHPGGAG